MLCKTDRLPMRETETMVIDYLASQPPNYYFRAADIAVKICRPYGSVTVVLRLWRSLEMLEEMKDGNDVYVRLDPSLRN